MSGQIHNKNIIRKGYTKIGRLVAATKELFLYDRYQGLLMEALSAKPTVKKSADVLLHMMGHVKKVLTADELSLIHI